MTDPARLLRSKPLPDLGREFRLRGSLIGAELEVAAIAWGLKHEELSADAAADKLAALSERMRDLLQRHAVQTHGREAGDDLQA